ncbi:hypothetical protein [Streptomyces sp. NBC_00390]|uniref:hypothetical protein n=1 Tax=Streptomyces sp. NBC_00390 TaxID=2975736 RepID=UPI003FCEB5F2
MLIGAHQNDTAPSTTAPASAHDGAVTLPAKHVRWDYQIGGAYHPPTGVHVVSRSHEDAPAPGVYLNAFQAQEHAEGGWDSDLLLRDAGGNRYGMPDSRGVRPPTERI